MPTLPPREFLMLAKKYRPGQDEVGGWYISEKLAGTRVFWDGGLSRGMPTVEVPYANVTNPKTGKPKRKIKPIASGLWSRYNNPILAPDWFLNQLPCIPLDGVIWAGHGNPQLHRSVCTGDAPGPDWGEAEFAVFGCPPIDRVFSNGLIKNARTRINMLYVNLELWITRRDPGVLEDFMSLASEGVLIPFDYELALLRESLSLDGVVYLHHHKRLPLDAEDAAQAAERELNSVLDREGMGIMLRDPDSPWLPKRVPHLLKYSPQG